MPPTGRPSARAAARARRRARAPRIGGMVSPNFPRRYDAAVDSDAVALRNVSLDLPGCCIVEGGAYMKETDRIVDQLRRAYEGEAWHGPSVREVLEGVTASQASA